jgi:hypothetical protein
MEGKREAQRSGRGEDGRDESRPYGTMEGKTEAQRDLLLCASAYLRGAAV